MTLPTPSAISGRSALDVARACGEQAGALALQRFRQPQDVSIKGRGNLLTSTDLELERLLQDELTKEFPEHRILSEETASETDTAGWVWVLDPLDGTRNFVSGIPWFCINIALCLDGEPVVAVTHDPNHRETFWAERGDGCWVNDHPTQASAALDLPSSVVGVDLGYDERRGRALLRLAHELLPNVQAVRFCGSAALGLAYAACGRFDIFVHRYLFPWDLAAGILLVREAGGTITNDAGGPIAISSSTATAGGTRVHADLIHWQREHASAFDLVGET